MQEQISWPPPLLLCISRALIRSNIHGFMDGTEVTANRLQATSQKEEKGLTESWPNTARDLRRRLVRCSR